ncbi:MAG: beta-glucosidase H [Breznakibacter sp.]
MMKEILLISILICLTFSWGAAQQHPFDDRTSALEQRVQNLISLMTLEEKIDMMAGYNDFYIHPVERLGVPAFIMADGPMGLASWGIHGRGTAFPATLGLAATWNNELAAKYGDALGQEWRARGLHFLLAPGVNMYRASKGARNFEYFGEDPLLTSEMVVPLIKAVQNRGVIATIKHFAANDQEFDRYTVSSQIDERTLREIYLPPFEAAVKRANVWAVMTGYNPVNGVWCTENKFLLNDILKKEWGFPGMVMSDWACTYSAVNAIEAGLDLEMGSKDWYNREKLLPLIQQGQVKEEQINRIVARILRPCFEMGFFDRPQLDASIPTYNQFANSIAHEIAQKGTVLLKNDSILPLSHNLKIAVIGPNANPSVLTDRKHREQNVVLGGGGSSKVNPWHITTLLSGMEQTFKPENILYHEGVSNRFVTELFSGSKFHTKDNMLGFEARYINNSTGLIKEQIDKSINFSFWRVPNNWKEFDDKNYSIEWSGFMKSPDNGSIRFFVQAQGAYKLYIDQKLVIDQWNSQSLTNESVSVIMEKDKEYSVRLEFAQRCWPAEIRLGYTPEIDFKNHPAVQLAKKADVVVFCGGFDAIIELEGRDRPFELPYGQNELISEIAKVNPNIVAVSISGGGHGMPWANSVKGILHAWYPGQSGGLAIAEILAGKVNPSAKLPISIEKEWKDSPAFGNYDEERSTGKVHYREGVFMGYRHFDTKSIEPQFPFGHGLSYTTFSYSNIKVTSKTFKSGDKLIVSVDVTNTGKMAGSEVVQLYVNEERPKISRPSKELKGFANVNLNPGESKTVSIALTDRAFMYYHVDKKKSGWRFDKGFFNILVGASSRDIRLKERVELK